MPKEIRLNDQDRERWVRDDEELFQMKQASHLPMKAFIKANRALIDRAISKLRHGSGN